ADRPGVQGGRKADDVITATGSRTVHGGMGHRRANGFAERDLAVHGGVVGQAGYRDDRRRGRRLDGAQVDGAADDTRGHPAPGGKQTGRVRVVAGVEGWAGAGEHGPGRAAVVGQAAEVRVAGNHARLVDRAADDVDGRLDEVDVGRVGVDRGRAGVL